MRHRKQMMIQKAVSCLPSWVTVQHGALIYAACVVPNLVVLALLSDIGIGLQVYSSIASTRMSIGGDLCVFLASISVALLYVGDWFYWKSILRRALAGVVPIMLAATGALLKGRKYPWAPLLFTLSTIPGTIGLLRYSVCPISKRRGFYKAVSLVTGVCACGMFMIWAAWIYKDNHRWDRETKDRLAQDSQSLYKYIYPDRQLNYTSDCHPELANLTQYSKTERPKITVACSKASAVWTLMWMSPVVAVHCNTVICVFSVLFGVMHAGDGHSHRLESELIQALKRFLLALVSIFALMYCSMSFASPAMTSTTLAFMATGLGVLMAWAFVEVGPDPLLNIAKETKSAQTFIKMWRSDWVRAIAVGAVNVFIPLYLLLNWMLQRVRLRRGTHGDHYGLYTKQFEKLVEDMDAWNWAGILTKVALLSELYFTFNVGVTKVTYIFLSWLGDQLAPVNFGLVVVLVFVIGFCMFLLPPVPGVPVYIFSGIVLADQARRNLGDPSTETGFIQGCAIAIVLGFVNKLCASCAQYMIGYFLGKSVKIQQFIKVDSVATRAIEKILNRKGLDIGKVAVLIGGHDWVVSVTCGILKINIPQMLLGTAPVLIIMTPCVLTGAFISRQGSAGEDSIFPMLASASVGCMIVGQVSAALVAFLAIMNVVQDHAEDLAQSRPEHKRVEDLTKSQQVATEEYVRTTKWQKLFPIDKAILLCMVGFHLLVEFIFVMMASACFLPFSVDKKIYDDIEDGGLGGNAFNIIVWPVGHGTLGLFFIAVCLHVFHSRAMSRRAKANLAKHEASLKAQGQQFAAVTIGAQTDGARATE